MTKMLFVRQTGTNYPAYIGYVDGKPVCWVEQAAGRNNGWSVHLYGTSPGDDLETTKLLWLGTFAQAKTYAQELVPNSVLTAVPNCASV